MYPVAWRGLTYYMHDLTVGMKNDYVKWAKQYLTQQGIENLSARPDLLSTYLSILYSELWWADGGMSQPLFKLMTSRDGGLHLNRLLFGDSVKALSDKDLQDLIDEKEAEQAKSDEAAKALGMSPPFPPVNDYAVAMQQIRINADPKAKTAATGPDPPA